MFKSLISGCICVTMLMGGNMEGKNIQYYLTNADQAYIIIDNKYQSIDNVGKLNEIINQMLIDGYEVPALGVSIHHETLKQIQKGVWLKLQYNGTQYVNDMPFDELIIELDDEYTGFNIVRGNKGIYEGRNYYINLIDNSMKELYDYLIQVFSCD